MYTYVVFVPLSRIMSFFHHSIILTSFPFFPTSISLSALSLAVATLSLSNTEESNDSSYMYMHDTRNVQQKYKIISFQIHSISCSVHRETKKVQVAKDTFRKKEI